MGRTNRIGSGCGDVNLEGGWWWGAGIAGRGGSFYIESTRVITAKRARAGGTPPFGCRRAGERHTSGRGLH